MRFIAWYFFAAMALSALGCQVLIPPIFTITASPPPPPVEVAVAPPADPPAPPADSYDDQDPAALTDFKAALDPNGTWLEDPTYGTVWVPNPAIVGADFAPYSNAGHWVHDDDWVWVSDYDWGWAPFHYGRWVQTSAGPWGWIPGREYRGAWVSWGADDDLAHLAWAPLAPEFLWFGGVPRVYEYPGEVSFTYVPREEIFAPNVGARVIRGPEAARLHGSVHVLPPEGAGRAGRAGPAPEKLGYPPEKVPHATGAQAANLDRAKGFSHPSTATALGARPPTRVASSAQTGAQRGKGEPTKAPGTMEARPSTAPGHGAPAAHGPAGGAPAARSAPVQHSAPASHSGGGKHR